MHLFKHQNWLYGRLKIIFLFTIWPQFGQSYMSQVLYTVAHIIDCVCSKMLYHGLNHGVFLSLLKLLPCHIHWIVLMCISLFKFHI